jgi:hypothetical protein
LSSWAPSLATQPEQLLLPFKPGELRKRHNSCRPPKCCCQAMLDRLQAVIKGSTAALGVRGRTSSTHCTETHCCSVTLPHSPPPTNGLHYQHCWHVATPEEASRDLVLHIQRAALYPLLL